MIKTLSKVRREETYLNIIKAIYEKPIANIILNSENLKCFFQDQKQVRIYTFTTFIQHSIGSPSHRNQTRKRNKTQLNQKEVKLSLFSNDMILNIENPKDSTKKSIKINEVSKIAEFKINIHRLVAFLYLNNKLSKLF